MNLSHNKELYIELFTQIARMHDEVDFRKHLNEYSGRRGKWKDYPAVSVGAEMENASAIGHHRSYSSPRGFHPLVYQELERRVGCLNEDSVNYPRCKNKVGHCAENYAASGALGKIDPDGVVYNPATLRDFLFTKAFKPRTWKNIDWCENCHTMFD